MNCTRLESLPSVLRDSSWTQLMWLGTRLGLLVTQLYLSLYSWNATVEFYASAAWAAVSRLLSAKLSDCNPVDVHLIVLVDVYVNNVCFRHQRNEWRNNIVNYSIANKVHWRSSVVPFFVLLYSSLCSSCNFSWNGRWHKFSYGECQLIELNVYPTFTAYRPGPC